MVPVQCTCQHSILYNTVQGGWRSENLENIYAANARPKLGLIREEEESLHPWVKVDQAARPLPPKRLSIFLKA